MRRKALLAMLAGLAGALRRCSLRLTAGTRLRAASGAPESTRLWSATDVLQFARSPFAAWMDRRYASATGDDRAALGCGIRRRSRPARARGGAWERDVLAALRRERDVVDLSGAARRVRGDPAGATAATLEAMESRADVIYQAPVADATFLGVPDFLVRLDDGSYAIWDAKLSRRASPNHVMQLCAPRQGRRRRLGGAALPSDLADLVEPARAKTKPCPVPAAHALDCYFDLEGDPFLGDRGREYLWGVSEQGAGGLAYSGAWAHDERAELDACRAFVAGVERRLEQSDGGAHVYHYGAYELSALRRVAASADRDLERRVEDLIGRGTFVDLYDVIKKHVLVGEPRYSLKNAEWMRAPGWQLADDERCVGACAVVGVVDAPAGGRRKRDLDMRFEAPQPSKLRAGDAVLIRDDSLYEEGGFDQLRRGTLVGDPKPDGTLSLLASEPPPFVQGPPGTGKTYLAARAIARLLEDGKRIALCAPSHATVANGVLAALAVVAPSDSIKVVKVGGRRRSKAPGAEDPERELAETAGVECRPRLDQTLVDEFLGGGAVLVGGSAWAFARDEARGRFDYLFVDEAGQVPAANVAAIAGCASNVVLLGDQMQLPAPQRAAHPGELAGASALEYYSLGRGDGGSLPADVGVFLDVSRRLHPALCGAISELVYGGRLRAHADAAKRTVPGATALASADAGLVVVGVESSADRGDVATANLEEAAVVARVVGDVLNRKVFRDGDDERPLAPGDVLVVCPYNAHVRAVEDALEAAGVAGVKVGTVDRFQGREAPVVVASLAVATGDDENDGDFDARRGSPAAAASPSRSTRGASTSPCRGPSASPSS
ncbi:ATP-dependent 5'-3' RNA helicase [Aureococcus anophagefferens]|nr:ATP-dependent 5'-3' RNA helicase [Aureococcus anophagefferens]